MTRQMALPFEKVYISGLTNEQPRGRLVANLKSTKMTKNTAPGKSHRRGITMIDLARMFPDEAAARKWFESILWPGGERYCPHCGTDNNHECSHPKMPYRCRDCRKYFSVKTGTVMANSPLPLQKWLYAIYLELTSLKGVSSMKLHRDLGITQKAAWFMLQRIREAFAEMGPAVRFDGPVEADEAYFGGLQKNMHAKKRKKLSGRGTAGKTAVVGVKDRETKMVAAKVVRSTDGKTLQGFVREHVEPGATVYSDDTGAYGGLTEYERGTVKHSVGEYVNGHIHTNGIESFWSMLKRAHKGVYHKLSPKHLQRYVDQFTGRHNVRDLDTIRQMAMVTEGMAGKRLKYRDLIKPNGLSSLARPPANEFSSRPP